MATPRGLKGRERFLVGVGSIRPGSRGPSGRMGVGPVDPGHRPAASALGWSLATLRAAKTKPAKPTKPAKKVRQASGDAGLLFKNGVSQAGRDASGPRGVTPTGQSCLDQASG